MRLLRDRIKRDGPIPVDEYMRLALGHPAHGYYMTRNPFGRSGDFVTAPDVSQIFGELVGLWCVDMWQRAGAPNQLRLIELGPGRGTLMADALRAAHSVPALEAIDVHMVETSPLLAGVQREALGGAPATWHENLADVPTGPAVILANEFFDALPVRQLVRTTEGWAERCVAVAPDEDRFAYVEVSVSDVGLLPASAEMGLVYELCPTADELIGQIAERLCGSGGALLVIDYGDISTREGATLQAVRGHRRADPLELPGEIDMTAHVDFGALAGAARRCGAVVRGPVTQRDFLRRLGAEARAAALCGGSDEGKRRQILAGLQRLIDPAQMGALFKVMCVTHPAWPAPDGMQQCF